MWGAAVKRGYKTGNINRKLTILVKIVSFECEITHANFWWRSDNVCQSYGKETNAPKFADPSMVAVSPYFKRSMPGIETSISNAVSCLGRVNSASSKNKTCYCRAEIPVVYMFPTSKLLIM